jgi:hypothetical protein
VGGVVGAVWAFRGCLGLSGLSGALLGLSGALWALWGSLGLSWLSGALLGSLGLSGALWALWGSPGVSSGLSGLSGALWALWAFLSFLELSWALWGSPGLSWALVGSLGFNTLPYYSIMCLPDLLGLLGQSLARNMFAVVRYSRMWCPHYIGRDSWVWGEQETL